MKFLSLLIGIAIIFTCSGLVSIYAQQGRVILYYNFDEDNGDVARDLSGSGNDGKITNAQWVAGGKIGGGMEFDGKSSLIEVPHNDSLSPGDQLTIMAWFYPLSIPASNFGPIARKGTVAESGWGLDVPSRFESRPSSPEMVRQLVGPDNPERGARGTS